MCLSCFLLQYPCLFLIRRLIDLAHDAAAALGHAGSHGGNGSSILTTHTLGLHSDTGDVSLACGVPHGDVLFHAARQAGVLLGRERGTRGRNASLEAVLVDFLGLLSVRCRIWISRVVTYSDQGAGVGHGGLLLELAHDCCLDLLRGLGGSGRAGTEKRRHYGRVREVEKVQMR